MLPGVTANRVPLSGACEGYKGDIKAFVHQLETALRVEVKARATAQGWQSVKKWLEGNDLLLLVEDREEPLAVMPFSVFEMLIAGLSKEELN